MAKASDNPYPSLLVVEGSAPASPAAGDQRLFIDTADHKLKRKDSSGTVTTVEGGSGGTTGARQVLAYASGAYPSRSGPTGQLYEYVGPTVPSTWVSGDTWIQTP